MLYRCPQDIFSAIEKGEIPSNQGLMLLREMDSLAVPGTKVHHRQQRVTGISP